MKRFFGAAIAALLGAGPASALTTIDFENLSNNSYVSGYYSQGVSFNGFLAYNNTYGGAVIVPSGSIYIQALGTAAIIFGGPSDPQGTGTVDYVSFSNAGLASSSTLYNGFTVRAFGTQGNLLDSQIVGPVGPNVGRGVSATTFSTAGIHSLVFAPIANPNNPNGSYGLSPIDTLVFNASQAAAPVPEAGEWAMLSLGLCIVGAAVRRRRR